MTDRTWFSCLLQHPVKRQGNESWTIKRGMYCQCIGLSGFMPTDSLRGNPGFIPAAGYGPTCIFVWPYCMNGWQCREY